MKVMVPLVLVVLAALGAFLYYQNSNKASTPVSQVSPGTPATNSPTLEGGNAVMVEDQTGGDYITVKLAVLEAPGFVVVHEATGDGKPGAVVGYSDYLEAGQHEAIDIELDNGAAKGDIFIAMLHGDDGDKEYTDVDEANATKDESGNVVMMKFTITSDAVEDTGAIEE